MKPLSIVTQKVTPSPIRQMFNQAIGLKDVISFTVGEPDFSTPDHIVEAAVAALRNGEHRYTPNAGILPLRQAIQKAVRKSHGLDYCPEKEIIVTAGGMEALMLLMMTVLDPGDELILGDPCWTNYSRQALICSAEPRFVPVAAENNFTFSPEALEAAITPKTKAFLINSPSNPTGGIVTGEQLEKLAEIAMQHDLFVISDEVYNQIVYDGNQPVSIASVPGMKERTIVVNSFSKTYAMTGWRVGYAVGPENVIQNMVKLQENVAACVNTAAQYGALSALECDQGAVKQMIRSYAHRRKLMLDAFSTIPGLRCFSPQGAFYLFVDISESGLSASEFAKDLLNKERTIVVPGHAFGSDSDKYVRLSFALGEEAILEGTARIRRYMTQRMNAVKGN